MTDLHALRARVQAATGPDRELDEAIMAAFYVREKRHIGAFEYPGGVPVYDDVWVDPKTDKWVSTGAFDFTRSIDDAVALIKRTLPGWIWKTCECSVSDDGWVCPDFIHPVYGERLHREIGPFESRSVWDEGFDVDRRPSGNPALALLEAMIEAKIALQERAALRAALDKEQR